MGVFSRLKEADIAPTIIPCVTAVMHSLKVYMIDGKVSYNLIGTFFLPSCPNFKMIKLLMCIYALQTCLKIFFFSYIYIVHENMVYIYI